MWLLQYPTKFNRQEDGISIENECTIVIVKLLIFFWPAE